MNVSRLKPTPENRLIFTLVSVKAVPAVAGCYVLTNYIGDVLYVGLTHNLYQRFKQHRDTAEKRQLTPLGRAHWFHFVEADKAQINAIERGWQNQYAAVHGSLPALNKVASPVR